MNINNYKNQDRIKVAIAGSYETDTGQKTSTLIEQIENLPDIELTSYYCYDLGEAKKVLEKAGIFEKFSYFSLNNKQKKDIKQKFYTDRLELFISNINYDTIIVSEINTEKAVEIIFKCLLQGKSVINLNAISEITLGLIFKKIAEPGSIYSVGAGDEPAATLQLIEFCQKLGLKIISAGKGKNNPINIYCTPEDFSEKAREAGVSPKSIASFVDGTKTMLEMAILSNATGYPIDKTGMHGPQVNVKQLAEVFCSRRDGGILNSVPAVDYAVGDVAPGVFVVFTSDQKSILEELDYLKMGKGPNFVLYKPYHLGNIESPLSLYDVIFEEKPTLTIKNNFVSSVAGRAKKDLQKGELLDTAGGYTYSGLAVDFKLMKEKGYIPIGLLEGSQVKINIKKDKIITFDDVELNTNSIRYNLWKIQESLLQKI